MQSPEHDETNLSCLFAAPMAAKKVSSPFRFRRVQLTFPRRLRLVAQNNKCGSIYMSAFIGSISKTHSNQVPVSKSRADIAIHVAFQQTPPSYYESFSARS